MASQMAWLDVAAVRQYTEGCYSSRGWGPIDPDRFDFTSCFESLLYALPIVILAVFGGWELARLTRKEDRGPKGRGRRSQRLYETKMALAGLNVALQAGLLGARTWESPRPIDDVAVWSNVAVLVSFIVALPLHHYAHKRSQRSSTALLFFYLFFLVIDAIRLRTLVDLLAFQGHLLSFVLFCVRLASLAVVFSLECVGPESGYGRVRLPEGEDGAVQEEEDEKPECPVEYANIFSQLTFSWMTPMMIRGYKTSLTEDDLWSLPRDDHADAVGKRLRVKWEAQLKKSADSGGRKGPSLAAAVISAFGAPYALAMLLKFIQDAFQFLQPQLLRRLLAFVDTYDTDHPEPAYHGYIIAFGMFACSIVQTSFLHQYFRHVFETGQRVRGGLIALVYSKSLVLSNEERGGRATGDIVNLMSTDVTRLQDVSAYGLIAVSGIFQIILAFVSLYSLLGPPMFAGVGVMLLSVPANTLLARLQTKLQRRQMKIKDSRTRMMHEILNNIRSIKLYAWENAFARKLFAIRNDKELALLRKMGFISSGSTFLWSFMPFLVGFSSFSIYAATSATPLTPAIVFPAISLFQLLQFPLNVLPMVINAWIEAYVSISRLWDFLTGKELQADASVREDLSYGARPGDELLSIQGGEFAWTTSEGHESTLRDINLHLKKGELIAVVGRVGCGKSSLLSATLGEMTRLNGSVRVRGKIAYAAQSPWLLSATVRQNIIFGHRWDEEFYEQVLDACALREDLAMLKEGDQTEVGEKGISLSGGQKARISIARAVYARADVYCLDDPLSAVDAHVARHLFDKVIGPEGLLKSKARLLCTNAIPFCQQADEIVMMRHGGVAERGSFHEVMAREGELKALLEEFGKKAEEEQAESSDSGSDTAAGTSGESGDDLRNGANGHADGDADAKRKMSFVAMRRASMVPIAEQKRNALRAMKESTKPKESRETGSVKRSVYLKYLQANGYIGSFLFVFTILMQQVGSIATNVFIKNWASHNSAADGNSDLTYYLVGYLALGVGTSLLLFINGIILYTLCVIRSAKYLHDSMFNAVMRAPMSFFEQTPIGTVINRFSRDVYVVDEVLARVMGGFFRTMAGVAGVVAVISAVVPPFLAVIIPLLVLYKGIQSVYLATSRELKRLDATTKSPIFAAFGETLSGVSTIRAFGQQGRFKLEMEARVDRNQEPYFASISCNRWLAILLELIGALIIVAAATMAVGSVSGNRNLDAGLVGLLMSYALSTTQSLNWVVRSATEVETSIVSAERVIDYCDLAPEAPLEIPDKAPSADWPEKGSVEYKGYECRYRDDLDLVLKDVSFEVKPSEKVGVCGRTGAGKSTITMALYRVIEPSGGTILIDGVDVSKIGLHDLRSMLSIIPQDSQCFEGTLRENLDPVGDKTDAELWAALESSKLKEHAQTMGGLEAKIDEAGGNLSAGQRALLSLARAILRKSRILVMDEATAAVDPETDRDLQAVIRQQFADTTMIIIAHRLNTILDCDRILVMSAGRVAEYDTPANLLANTESLFYGMAKEAGIIGTSSGTSSNQ